MTDLRLISEYTLLFSCWLGSAEFGVFVDHRGQRSRQSDIKWSGLPLSFCESQLSLTLSYRGQHQTSVEWKCQVFTRDTIRICSPCFFLITTVWIYEIDQSDLCGAVCICFLEVILKEGITQDFKKSLTSMLCHHQRFDWMINKFYWQIFWHQFTW